MVISLIKIIFWLILLTLAIAALSLAPWVPTKRKDLKRIKKLANLKEGDIFYDLGCGDGRVTSYISKNPKITTIGIELAIPFYFICKLRELFNTEGNLNFKLKSLFQEDLSDANIVYIFAANSKKISGKLVEKMERELKSGTKVISYAFPIKEWIPKRIDQVNKKEVAIYLYEI